jgi:hypothetical protein
VEAFMLPKVDLGNFVADLKKDREVLGPVAKVDEFVFAPIDDVGALCLDYDTTILPPAKKFIHMPGEVLFEFESAVHGKDLWHYCKRHRRGLLLGGLLLDGHCCSLGKVSPICNELREAGN